MLDKAIAIAAQAFIGKEDKGGKPYILHCIHVMLAVKELGSQAMIAGVLHDLIEDTDWTPKMLLAEGFDERTVKLVVMLTHKEDETYEDYVARVSLNPITRAVKIHDLRHNSDIMRMKGLLEKDFERLKKYHHAFDYLRHAESQDASKG